MRHARGIAAALWMVLAPLAFAQDAALVVHLLDYIAVDYAEAVEGGRVKNEDEYKEMTEFAANVEQAIAKLPAIANRASLEASAKALRERVAMKAMPAEVATHAQRLRQAIVAAYNVPVGPKRAPDLARGTALYAEHCAGCHGTGGRGDGALAKGMEPAPSDFHDLARQRQRSAHGLFNTITRGVEGTGMRAFGELAEPDRWALAYVAANFGATDADRARGKALWEAKGASLAPEWASHAAVAGRTPLEVKAVGGDDALAILAFLRSEPKRLDQGKPSPLEFARTKLEESLVLHGKGDIDDAVRTALAAYLEGFELVEASLSAVNPDLMRRTEAAMIAYRGALQSGTPRVEVQKLAKQADGLLEDSAAALGVSLSAGAAFAASFVILLREGLEAILVVTALLAFLRRGGQSQALPYVHAGWIVALLAGALTWYVATTLVAISGAHREAAEGIAALAASAMLLYVGFWLHDKSHARSWQAFLMRHAGGVRGGAAWGLALTAFLAVYREVFETVLFYQALWLQAPGREAWMLAGLAVAAGALAAITFAMLRYSVRMPLGLFFGASGILLAILAVVLAGNGVAALQEAGWLPVTPFGTITISWLGIYPNAQALGTQLVLGFLVALLLASSRKERAA